MKTIVIKAKLKSKLDLFKTLADIDLKFGDIYYQHDRIFLPRGFKPDRNLPKLLIRTNVKRADKSPTYSLIFKRHLADQDVDITHRTDITDYTETAYTLHQLGFQLFAEVTKQRQNLIMDDGIRICVDQVEGLGVFIKIESQIKPDDTPKFVYENLKKTLTVLKVDSSDIIDDTYANLLLNSAHS